MQKKRKNIRIGYVNLLKKSHISSIEINNNFLNLLNRYADVKIVSLAQYKEIKKFFKEIEKYNFDYFFVDTFTYLLSSFLLRERLGLDIPFILPLHTIYPWVHNYVYVIPLIREYDIIYAPSQYAKEAFLKISDKLNIHMFPYCLDIQSIRNAIRHDSKKENKIITFMGRLTKQKGIETLIQCLPEIVEHTSKVRLQIIGPLSGSGLKDEPLSPYVKKLKREIKKLGLNNKVTFRGAQFGSRKYSLLSVSDVFVTPTVAPEETFQIVNIEALACGIPVITTKWAGITEVVTAGKNGYLLDIYNDRKGCPKVNQQQLASLIIKLLKNDDLTRLLKKNAVRTALTYDYHKVLPPFLTLLKKRTMQ
ncbi:MAG: glycosyltransferase family 4 protein, partial [Candidatus Omnitrophota bacterium]